MTKSVEFENIKNIKLHLIETDGSLNEQSTTISQQLWSETPVLFLVIRRPVDSSTSLYIYYRYHGLFKGCPACRELANELWLHADTIKSNFGIELVAIMKENLVDDIAGFREFFGGRIYIDYDLSFYKALTGGKLVHNNIFGALLNPAVWKSLSRALKKVKSGSLRGDASIYGGVILASSKGVHYQYNEVIGQLPSVNEILNSMKSAVSSDSAIQVENGNVKRPVCHEDVCLRA